MNGRQRPQADHREPVMKHLVHLAAVLAIILGAAGVQAQTQAPDPSRAPDAPRMPVTQANIEQKAKFVTNLVTNSASVRAMEQSGDTEAIQALQAARKLVEETNGDTAQGRLQAADDKLNKAIDMVMSHTRRITELTVKGNRAQQIYDSRLASVKALLEALDRVAKDKNATTRVTDRRASIVQLLAEIEALAKSGNYETAVVQLDKAYTSITTEVAKLRDGDKLTKELSFASAEEEYVYEIDRNDSHQFLLKLTLNEKPAHPSFAPQIDAMRADAEELRKQAEAKAKAKDYASAIKALGESTEKLIKSLRMAGAYIPG
jgi:hypothetical protein